MDGVEQEYFANKKELDQAYRYSYDSEELHTAYGQGRYNEYKDNQNWLLHVIFFTISYNYYYIIILMLSMLD